MKLTRTLRRKAATRLARSPTSTRLWSCHAFEIKGGEDATSQVEEVVDDVG
jgi:hypothetical protein